MSEDPRTQNQSFPPPPPPPPPPLASSEAGPGAARLLVPVLVGAAVAVALGVYGKVHDPAATAFNLAGFSSPKAVKSWLTSVAFAFGLVQLFSALTMYGQMPGVRAGSWTPVLHRWSGRAAFLVAVPVAVHCLYSLGFQTYDTRVTLHSLFGCFFFGAFSAKMLLLRMERLPGWLLPIVGGLVFAALMMLWLTSVLWFFRVFGVTT
ncbi:DUF6529 family protein [Streptomyces formicae]|uniref:DUF998 domain-containing protein n=1 Tax=Streptomyces formicae TaxID=1616117 RepID=A0ABY3WUV2_9ACTN|nr:DUF6529 family protein [Streptomyces formicae]UNM14256.1 hypothetical protein J4032_24820 [Streptomyces formicae]